MSEIVATIHQWFCRHDWKATRFQALVPGTSYCCTKCGKRERFYSRPSGGGRHGE